MMLPVWWMKHGHDVYVFNEQTVKDKMKGSYIMDRVKAELLMQGKVVPAVFKKPSAVNLDVGIEQHNVVKSTKEKMNED